MAILGQYVLSFIIAFIVTIVANVFVLRFILRQQTDSSEFQSSRDKIRRALNTVLINFAATVCTQV